MDQLLPFKAVSNSEADKPTRTHQNNYKLAIIKPNIPIPLALNEDVSNATTIRLEVKLPSLLLVISSLMIGFFLQRPGRLCTVKKPIKINKHPFSRSPFKWWNEVENLISTTLKSVWGQTRKAKYSLPSSAYQKNVQIQ